MLAFGLKQAVFRNCSLSPDSDGLSQELRAPAATRRGDAFQGGEWPALAGDAFEGCTCSAAVSVQVGNYASQVSVGIVSFIFFEAFVCIFLTSACEAVLEGSEKSMFLSSQRLHGSHPGVLPTLVVQTHLSEKRQATQQFRKTCFCCCRSIVSKIRKINTMNLKKINLEDVWLGVLSLFNAVCLGKGRWISRFQEDYI